MHLTRLLLGRGHKVSHLSRSAGKNQQVKTFIWNVEKGEIDESCLDGVDTIVHLAGAGIADKRWTDERKTVLINSRTQSIAFLYSLMKRKPHGVQKVVSASGVGYYSDRGNELLTEENLPAHDFLGQCCVLWEAAVDEGAELGLKIVKFRTGVVLDKNDGALPQLSAPVKFGFGAPLGSGSQWVPWIHWKDVAAMYLYGIEHDMEGVYNMCAPNPVTNRQLTKAVAKALHKPLWAPRVPAFVLKAMLGQLSTLVLGSTRALSQKVQNAGFTFEFTDVNAALKDIYGK